MQIFRRISTRFPSDGAGVTMSNAYANLFRPIRLGNCEIRNRIVLTGHGTGMGRDGKPDSRMIAYYERRAKGGVGLIMLGSLQVHPTSPGITGLLTNYGEEAVPALAKVVKVVHRHGTRIFGYLSHMGLATTARPGAVWSASTQYEQKFGEVSHAMTRDEIAEIVEAFAAAAERCMRAGFDGIEVHCGHGLLLQQFLSPLTNRRSDEYGGSSDNRLRFPSEVLRAVRARIGPSVPLGIRCSIDELIHGGLTLDDMIAIVPRLVAAGQLDYVDASAGNDGNLVSNMLHEPPMGLEAAPFAAAAARIRTVAGVPVIHATRIHTPELAERLIADGQADMAGMCRALIADPDLPKKAAAGRTAEINPCVACEQACLGRLARGTFISCVGNPATGREFELRRLARSATPKRVAVVGGGPAGLEAARVAALRGHSVTLYEEAAVLGGKLNLASIPPGRSEWRRLIESKSALARRAGVDIRLATRATADMLAGAEAVVLATGSIDDAVTLPGADSAPLLSVGQAIAEVDRVGRNVLVIDLLDRQPALTLALLLAERGRQVEVASAALHVGQKLEIQNLTLLYRSFLLTGGRLTSLASATAFDGGTVTFVNPMTGQERLAGPYDTIVFASPGRPRDELAAPLRRAGVPCHVIGDAYAPRDVEAAILEGFSTASTV
jgi:2,4-dienoyl-CoA reductase-like NADH-dependent reductase (Old Yellow Enzyme family)